MSTVWSILEIGPSTFLLSGTRITNGNLTLARSNKLTLTFPHISTLKLPPSQPLAVGAYIIVAAMPVSICVNSGSQSIR